MILGEYPALMGSQNLKHDVENTMAAGSPLLLHYLDCRILVVKHLQHGWPWQGTVSTLHALYLLRESLRKGAQDMRLREWRGYQATRL